MAKTTQIARSAVTGRFTTMQYATRHPKTTVVETIKVGQTKKRK